MSGRSSEFGPPLALIGGLTLFGAVKGVLALRDAGVPTWVIIALAIAAASVLVLTAIWLWNRFGPRDSSRVARDHRRIIDLTGRQARAKGQELRASLKNNTTAAPSAYGVRLGSAEGRDVWASWEDVMLVFMGPRSNKTSAIAVPTILSAPGPVIATSNKPDLWTLTAGLRSQVGRVYTFDPQQIVFARQEWWWNPLKSVTTVEGAERLSGFFMREVGGQSERADPFFTQSAAATLSRLLLAAGTTGGTLRDVRAWVRSRSTEPVRRLKDAGLEEEAGELKATIELPVETRGGIYASVSTALTCLGSEAVLRWVTPPETWKEQPSIDEAIDEFDPWELVAGRDGKYATLYLLSQEGEGTVRPVIAAFVDRVFKVATQASTAHGGRIDPPLTAMLDEAANICKVDDLPDLYSHFGSRGICVTTILQSREQGRDVWGRAGMGKLWGAATVAIVGAGVKDPEFCREISELFGEHEVTKQSQSSGSNGRSTSTSTQWEPIMRTAQIASLSKRNAVLITSGRAPVVLDLAPWYDEDDAGEIKTHASTAVEQIRAAAIERLGSDNPVVQAIQRETVPASGTTNG